MCVLMKSTAIKMYRVVCLMIFVTGSLGQVIKPGLCDYTNIGGFVSDLNITRMFGTWNQIARISNNDELGECSSVTFEGNYDATGSLLSVQLYYLEVIDRTKHYHNGTIIPSLIDGWYYMNLTGFLEGEFIVQATNYVDYAILYSCHTLTVANEALGTTDTKLILAWQYHRKATLSTAEQASVQVIVNTNPDLRDIQWKHISHTAAVCGDAGVSLSVSHGLIVLATLFISKEFV